MDNLRITPAMDRRNGMLFLGMYLFIFFAAPVSYIGVVQAALCDKLGSNATIANLPSAGYLLGGFAPFIFSVIVPHRWDRAVVVWSNALSVLFMGVVFVALVGHFPPSVPLMVLAIQALLQGFTFYTSQVFTFQCLARGTTLNGRHLAFKRTYSLSPIAAVVGSLAAQYVLSGGLHVVTFPYDFALLYLVGFICITGVTFLSSRFELASVEEERSSSWRQVTQSLPKYVRSRPLVLLFGAYTLWYCALSVTPNLSLYTRHAIGREPKELSGLIMAIRFACKSLGGYLLGVITLRWGLRLSVMTCSLLLALGTLWGWTVPGYAFLLAFGILGAGELGGAYIPNFGVALSTSEDTARNLSILTLASTASSFSPALFGFLADRFGFGASFTYGILMAFAALWLTSLIREPKHVATKTV